ncbi:MAG: hypothetical protein F7B59_03855 [Desulfurococcales archaeon]|nr:hypothetical protein [Desulfurococcales archaeon]
MKRKLDDYLGNNDCNRVMDEIKKLEDIVMIAVKSMRGDIEDIRKRIEVLESQCIKNSQSRVNIGKSQLSVRNRDKKGEAVLDFIREKIDSQGYVMASSVFNHLKIKPRQVVYLARNAGLKVIESGGDYIITSIGTLVELENRLFNLHSTDVNEAIKKAGNLSDLFEVLRRYGMVYYDARIKGWKISLD